MRRVKLALCLTTFVLLADCGSSGGGDQNDCDAAARASAARPIRGTPEVAADGTCLSFVEGPPVGLACLHCLQPEARAQADLLARLMGTSCRRNVATFVLVDGSFGDDQEFLKHLIRTVVRHGSRLDLYLYLTNGPWQRRDEQLPDRGFATHLPPEEFRVLIQSDEQFREAFRTHVRNLVPVFSFAVEQGVRLNLLPALEDNLDAPSARAIEALVVEAVPPSIPYRLGRNPCRGCYKGNDTSVPDGLFEDQHIHSLCNGVRVSNGLVSNDGETFRFPGEAFDADLEFEDMFLFAKRAAEKSNSFVLWKGEFQGRALDGAFIDPADRQYVVPNEPQQALLLDFLRAEY